jgi:hypothetical protein
MLPVVPEWVRESPVRSGATRRALIKTQPWVVDIEEGAHRPPRLADFALWVSACEEAPRIRDRRSENSRQNRGSPDGERRLGRLESTSSRAGRR